MDKDSLKDGNILNNDGTQNWQRSTQEIERTKKGTAQSKQ